MSYRLDELNFAVDCTSETIIQAVIIHIPIQLGQFVHQNNKHPSGKGGGEGEGRGREKRNGIVRNQRRLDMCHNTFCARA